MRRRRSLGGDASRKPLSSSRLPCRARAPLAPRSAQVWRRHNGCSARRARPSGSPRPAAPAPPRRRPRPDPAAAARGALGCLGRGGPCIRPRPHPRPARAAGCRVPDPRAARPGPGRPPGCASAGVREAGARCSEREGRSAHLRFLPRADGWRDTRWWL